MKGRNVLKLGALGGAVILSLSLSGCSHENPLKKASQKAGADFLYSASVYAGKKLGQPGGGGYYLSCMVGNQTKKTCDEVYNYMVAYAQTTKSFRGLTVADLTNPETFSHFRYDYQRKIEFTI